VCFVFIISRGSSVVLPGLGALALKWGRGTVVGVVVAVVVVVELLLPAITTTIRNGAPDFAIGWLSSYCVCVCVNESLKLFLTTIRMVLFQYLAFSWDR